MTTPTHEGSRTRYRNGCRCDACRAAVITYDRERQAHRTPEQREARRRRARERYREDPRRWLSYHRRKRYGITDEEYGQMLAQQNGRCAICAEPFLREPHVDHVKDTKIVRGLLCAGCNTGIGLLKHNPETLRLAIAYLERAKGRTK